MDQVERFLEAVSILESTSLRPRPKDDVQVAIASALGESFEAMTPSERDTARSVVGAGSSIGDALVSLSGLLAEVAINKKRPDLLRAGLILHAIEDFSGDPRENIRRLVLIFYAAERLNVSLSSMIASMSGIATDNGKSHLGDFARRSMILNQLHSFGIRADETGGIFRFVPVPELQRARALSRVELGFGKWERLSMWLIGRWRGFK